MKKIRTIGLGLFVALALTSALGAGTASAAQFKAEEFPATFKGEGLTNQLIKVDTGKIQCSSASFSTSTSAASSTLALLSATWNLCKFVGLQMSISWNGCHFTVGSSAESPPYSGSVGVACAGEGEAIEVTASNFPCTVTIPAQSGLSGVSYENLGSGSSRSIKATLNVSGLSYTESSMCVSPGAHSDGTYTTSYSIHGFNAKGVGIGVFLG